MEKIPDEINRVSFGGEGVAVFVSRVTKRLYKTSFSAPENEAQRAIFRIDYGCNGATWNHTKAKVSLGGAQRRQHGLLLSELRFFGYFNIFSIIPTNFTSVP